MPIFRRLPQWQLLAFSGVAVSHTGSTTETALATVSVPGGMMGANGAIRIRSLVTVNNDASAKSHVWRAGGVAGTIWLNSNLASLVAAHFERTIANRNSQSSQVTFSTSNGNSFTTTTGANATTAFDTSATFNLVLTAALADATDTMTLEMYSVEILSRS